jgi:predicted Zn-dependent protease
MGQHGRLEGHDLVVLPSRRLLAFTVSDQPGQVVVTDGLIDALDDDELAALLWHEAAHPRRHHRRHLLLAGMIDRSLGMLPPVRHSTAALRCALERWADEEAAASEVGRASVRSALLRSPRPWSPPRSPRS